MHDSKSLRKLEMERLGCSFSPLVVTGSLLSVTMINTMTTNNLEKKWSITATEGSQWVNSKGKGAGATEKICLMVYALWLA